MEVTKHGRYNIVPAHPLSGSVSSNSEPPIPTSRLPGQSVITSNFKHRSTTRPASSQFLRPGLTEAPMSALLPCLQYHFLGKYIP
ncbi:hypothetical protein FALCPG4_014126 [Fusarium falciforme]